MRISVVGCGVVGLATGKAFARFGHQVSYSDIDPKARDRVGDAEFTLIEKGAAIPPADVHFICVPEDVAPDVVRRFKGTSLHSPIVIRSSVPPGTTVKLAKELKRDLWHNPEFLREATSEQDVLWAKYTIVGSTKSYDKYGRRSGYSRFDVIDVDLSEGSVYAPPHNLAEAYKDMGVEVFYCTSTESELVKLLTNTYLATLISIWNENKVLCDALGVNSHKVARLVALDKRVSKYGAYMHGAPYGGRCLPKDIAQTIDLGYEHNIPLELLHTVYRINTQLGGK